MKNDILCCILNYNEHQGACKWADLLGKNFKTVILDSGSNPPCVHELALNLPNIYYSGLFNKAQELLHEYDYRWLMVVTSDVEIDQVNAQRLIASMKDIVNTENVGLYQPSCRWSYRGRALPQSLCHFTGRIRKVNFQEGWFHLVRRDLVDTILPVDCSLNQIGWGIDLALCHAARMAKLHILVDDRIKVLHPRGSGYNKDKALVQMRAWHATIPGYTSPRHFSPDKSPITYLQK